MPLSYFQRYGLTDGDDFLADFVEHWPTDRDDASVEGRRRGNTGTSDEFRVTERWTSSSKSNFQFHVQGQVACQQHEDKRPVMLFDIQEQRIYAYGYEGFKSELSATSQASLAEQYEQAEGAGQMVVFVRDNDNRRLVSYSIDCE